MISSLRKAFLSGLVLLAPLGITFFVFNWLVIRIGGSFKNQLLFFVPDELIAKENLEMVWNALATIIVLLLITLLGYLSRYVIAKYLFSIEERILKNVPIVNTVYTSVKQIVDTFSSDKRAVFEKVAMVQFPRPGCYAIGFLTGDTKGEIKGRLNKKTINVFVPTTPNPTSGFLVMLPEEDVQILDMSVGEGMKLIISGGAVVPEWPARAQLVEADSA